MITTILKTAATAAGCDQVVYESDKLANLITDQSLQGNIFCLILQTNSLRLSAVSNGIREHYPSIQVEIMQQVELENMAENNEAVFENLKEICKTFVWQIVESGSFQKIGEVPCEKIPENKYDANMLGWSMTFDLTYIQNTNQC